MSKCFVFFGFFVMALPGCASDLADGAGSGGDVPNPGDVGNVDVDAGCDGDHPTCTPGTACDDGNACTGNDVCQADGTCAGKPGAQVYAFLHADPGNASVYYYATSSAAPAGFTPLGPAFHLVPPGAGTVSLYLLRSDKAGDYMLATDPNEGDNYDLGYDPLLTLGSMFTSMQPGTIPLLRWFQAVPLRHYGSVVASSAPASYQPDREQVRGYVCP